MYTRCPDCQTAFRLTAAILKKAQGRVRCGGCGSTFNALDHLSENRPDDDPSSTQTARAFDERSRELLESLDELAGGDEVRIEDTGVEWRVLDEDDGAEPAESPDPTPDDTSARWTLIDGPNEPALDAANPDDTPWRRAGDTAAAPDAAGPRQDQEELRFDDHTPLPDEFFQPSAQFPQRDTGADDEADEADSDAVFDESPMAFELAGEDDWEELLDEVDFDGAEPRPAGGVGDEPGNDEDTRARDPDEDTGAEPRDAADEDTVSVDLAGETDPAAADELPADSPEAEAERPEADSAGAETEADIGAAEPAGADDAAAPDDDDAELSPEDPSSVDDEIDRELMQAAAGGGIAAGRDDLSDPDPMLVETIVMEGDSVTDLLMKAEEEAAEEDADEAEPELGDAALGATGSTPRPAPSPRVRGAMIAASALLGILLVAQLVHANRQALATYPLFESTVAPLYRALGDPVAPAWNIRGWRFESTDGSTDAAGERLTIHSRISNGADSPLPYPLVHVSLTDRFDEVIGSRLLEPEEYLAGSGSVSRPLPPGQGFTAVIAIAAPAAEATGYKLNVCYPLAGGRVRCAIENFRD